MSDSILIHLQEKKKDPTDMPVRVIYGKVECENARVECENAREKIDLLIKSLEEWGFEVDSDKLHDIFDMRGGS